MSSYNQVKELQKKGDLLFNLLSKNPRLLTLNKLVNQLFSVTQLIES